VICSLDREHAATWAHRLYCLALRTDADELTLLNDDCLLPGRFEEIVSAMHSAARGPLSLHTTHPMAEGMLRAGLRWFQSYWYTGPAVSFKRADLQSLVNYRASLPRWFLESRNEDNIAMQWAWSRKTAFWHPLPAVAKHDVDVPSSLGYDKHPLRTAIVTWADVRGDLTTGSFWHERHEPLLVECPWMTHATLDGFAGMVGHAA
jgi:hypothetical protein